MTHRGIFILLAGILLLAAAAAASADPTEQQANVSSFAPSPEPEFDAPLSPQYLLLSPESEYPAPDSPETGLESPSPLYPPDVTPPSPEFETGSPPEPSFESSPREFLPVPSPAPEMEPADSDSSVPSTSLQLPSMAPITGDDNDAEPAYEPTPSSSEPLASDQSNGITDEESAESYSEQDRSADSSSSDQPGTKGGNGTVYGVVAGACLVGIGGLVCLKRKKEKGTRRSKYDQYLELSKKEGV